MKAALRESRTGGPTNVRTVSRMPGKEKSPRYRFTDQDRLETERLVWHS